MGMIQKRADQLKTGDVVVEHGSKARQVVVYCDPQHTNGVKATLLKLGAVEPFDSFSVGLDANEWVMVESPDLTPAQLRAEELADRLRDCASMLSDSSVAAREAKELLAKIKPPEPPTLAEALESVYALLTVDSADAARYEEQASKARGLLDRARGTKVWP